jgi:Bacterial TniB protein
VNYTNNYCPQENASINTGEFANSQNTLIINSGIVSISHSYCGLFTNHCLQVHASVNTVPQKPNSSPLFTGQKDVLNRLEKIFADRTNNRPRRCCLLWGMGGIGKTQICLKFTEEMSDR